jgi:hypothetical protein
LAYTSDAVLFLGFSLIDSHVRQAFADYRDGRDRPVVFVDYADDDVLLSGSGFGLAGSGPARAIEAFRAKHYEMEWLGHKHAGTAGKVKAAKDFERSDVSGRRLSIWYGGMLEACRHTNKIIRELRS